MPLAASRGERERLDLQQSLDCTARRCCTVRSSFVCRFTAYPLRILRTDLSAASHTQQSRHDRSIESPRD